jgi:hypothetical protein
MISLAFHVDNSKFPIFDTCQCFQGRGHRWKLYNCSADIYNTVSLDVYIVTVFWGFCILFGVDGFTLGDWDCTVCTEKLTVFIYRCCSVKSRPQVMGRTRNLPCATHTHQWATPHSVHFVGSVPVPDNVYKTKQLLYFKKKIAHFIPLQSS